jgi:hypothetical protein
MGRAQHTHVNSFIKFTLQILPTCYNIPHEFGPATLSKPAPARSIFHRKLHIPHSDKTSASALSGVCASQHMQAPNLSTSVLRLLPDLATSVFNNLSALFVSPKTSTPAESTYSSLFSQNTRGGGYRKNSTAGIINLQSLFQKECEYRTERTMEATNRGKKKGWAGLTLGG